MIVYQAGVGEGKTTIPNFAWVVRNDGFQIVKLAIGERELVGATSKIRSSLRISPKGLGLFPYEVADNLYRKIFAPLEPFLRGARHLMIVPDGSLSSLPLSLLLRSPYEGEGTPDWLARRYAITTLPSVSSLRALRVLAKNAGPGEDRFKGFGDPVLQGRPGDSRGISFVPIFKKGTVADAEAIRRLPRLPDTARELKMIAGALGAGNDNVYLGKEATEKRVKSLDLSRTNVIAFATHGLVAGELRGVAEPGLVMTPPDTGSPDDDGILTASEVAQLKLHPGLVILSACNTAGPDGQPGAEALSGLARAFFYAGSQSLLVSHWPVSSKAATRLTTSMFASLRNNPGIGRSEALRRSMMKLAANDNYRHPFFWAPFTIVGEGAAAAR